jgi:tetratricopeptide (TPR) repeat protein
MHGFVRRPDIPILDPAPQKPAMRPRRFLVSFLLASLLLVAGVPLVNLVIDPFGIFELVSIPGINAQRLQSASQARLAKAERACIVGPVSSVLGTSRVEVGMNPDHPGWHNRGPVYSMALAGIGIGELEMTLRHLVRSSPRLKEVNVGIDFLMFNANREAVVIGTQVINFDADRLLLNPGDNCLKTYLAGVWEVLGPPALRYAWATIAGQLGPKDLDPMPLDLSDDWFAQYDPNGFRGSFFSVNYQRANKLGFRAVFGAAAGQEIGYVRRVWRPLPTERYCLTAPGQPPTLEVFRDLVRFAQQSGVKVNIFINPVHARLLIALREAGLWPIYEDWKRGLVAANEEVAKEVGKPPLALWDFSGFNTVTNERIPAVGDTSFNMKYWWESSHYQEATGELILDRILDYHAPDRQVPPDFGVPLTGATIEDWILRTRAGALQYMADFPEESDLVISAVDDVLKDARGTNCGFDATAIVDGSQLLQDGDAAGAEAKFSEAIRMHEEDAARYAALGVPYAETGFANMLSLARQGIVLEPPLSNWREYVIRARKREAEADLSGALLDYDEAMRLGPPQPSLFSVYSARGQLKLKLADYEGAIADFGEGLKIRPENQSLPRLLDSALRRMKNSVVPAAQAAITAKSYTEAVDMLGRALDYIPEDSTLETLLVTALNRRARELRDAGDIAGADADVSASRAITAGNAGN